MNNIQYILAKKVFFVCNVHSFKTFRFLMYTLHISQIKNYNILIFLCLYQAKMISNCFYTYKYLYPSFSKFNSSKDM